MEQLYSIGTTNRYAMLGDDEDDPGEVILPPGKEPTNAKTAKSEPVKENTKTSKPAKGKENRDKSLKQNKVVDNANKGRFS